MDKILKLLGIAEKGIALIPQVEGAMSIVNGVIALAKEIAAGSREVSDEEVAAEEAKTDALVAEFKSGL